MKKLKVLFICFVIMLCGIVFNSCSCSGEVYPIGIVIHSKDVSFDDANNIYIAAEGDEITFSYELSPKNDVTYTAITIEVPESNIELIGDSAIDNGASGSFSLKCNAANVEGKYTTVRVYYGSESAYKNLKISVIKPEPLAKVQNIRVDESYNLVWDSVGNATGYEVLVNDGVKNYELFTTSATLEGATYKTSENTYKAFEIKEGVTYSVKVMATNPAPEFENGEESEEFNFCVLPQPKVVINNGTITFEKNELEKFASVIKGFTMGVNADSVGFVETSLEYIVQSKNLDIMEGGAYSNASVLEVSLQTIAKSSTNGVKYYSSKIKELTPIRRLNVQGLRLENGNYLDTKIENFIESRLVWVDSNNEIDSNDFEYLIEVRNSLNQIVFANNWTDSKVNVADLFDEMVSGTYTIEISAKAKDGAKSKYINSEPVSKTFTVGALSSISANVDSNGLLKIEGFGEADFQTLSGVLFEINGNEYVYSSEFTNSEYYINLSNEIESNGNLVVNVYAIGRTTTDENFLGYVNAKVVENKEVNKLNGVSESEFNVNSNRTLTWSFAGECEKFNISILDSENIKKETFEIGFDGANLVESSGGINKYSLDFSETVLSVGETYNFEIYVAQSGKISSSKTIIKNIQVKEAINEDQITATFDISSKKNKISWGIADSVIYSINGGVEKDTNEGNVIIDNITGQVSVGLKVVGVVNKFLDSSVTTKIFNRTEIENLTIKDGKISLEEGNYFVEVTDSLNVWTTIIQSNADDILDLNSFQYDYINGSSQTGELEIEIGKDYVLTILKFDDDSFCSDYKSIKLGKFSAPVFEISKNGSGINYKFDKAVKYLINGSEEKDYQPASGVVVLAEEDYSSEIIAYAPASVETSLLTGVEANGNTYFLRSDSLEVSINKLVAPEINLTGNNLSWEMTNGVKYLLNGNEEVSPYTIDVDALDAGEHEYTVQALGNITIAGVQGINFYIDSDVASKIAVKSEPIEAELSDGVVSWATINNAEFKFEFNGSEIKDAQIGEDGGISYLNLSDKVSGEDGEYSFRVSVKREGDDFYSNFSEMIIKFKNVEDIKINDNNLFIKFDDSISNSCRIVGLKDDLEVKVEEENINLYVNESYLEKLELQDGFYRIDISEYVEYINEKKVQISLEYSNTNGYLNVSKTFNIDVVKLEASVNTDGNIEISGASNIKTIITHNISEELTTNLKTLDFSISELIGVKEGEIKINSTPIIDEDSLVLYKGIEEQLFELAPAADLYSESGVLKFNLENAEYSNYKYLLFKNGSYAKEINTSSGEISISLIEEDIPGIIKIKVIGKNNSSVVANNRGTSLSVNRLSAPTSISVNTSLKTLNWAYVNGASKYEIKLLENATVLGESVNNSFGILNNSAEVAGLKNGVGIIKYQVGTIGNSVEVGSDKVAYLNNDDTIISIDVSVQNKFIDNTKIENGKLTWGNTLTDAKFKVSVYDKNENLLGAKETYGTAFDVASLVDGSGVYLCSVELIHAENTILYKEDQPFVKYICLDANDSFDFDAVELEDGLIRFDITKGVWEGYVSLIESYNSIEPTDKKIETGIGFPESILELFIELSVSDDSVYSVFKEVKVLVNGVSYDFNIQIDTDAIFEMYPVLKTINYKDMSLGDLLATYHELTQIKNSMTEIPVYIILDERFGEGDYEVQLGYKPVDGLDIVVKNFNNKTLVGKKPSTPYCPTNPAEGYNAFKNDGSGTLIFNYSYINGAIVKDYYIAIIDNRGDVVDFVKYTFPEGYEFNEINQTAEIDLNEIFFKEDEERLEYNVVYGVQIATAGNDEYFMSNLSGLPNCFGKLKATSSFTINDGLISFSDVCDGSALDYIGDYTILLIDEYGNEHSYKYQDLDSEMFLEGLEVGSYSASLILIGDGYGIINSEPISFGFNQENPASPDHDGLIYKLINPQAIDLNKGMFSWKTVNADGSGAEVKYQYRFVVQSGDEPDVEEIVDETWRNEYSTSLIDGETFVFVELPNEFDGESQKYKIQVVSYVEGENYFVRSNISESPFYRRKNAPTSIALAEDGKLTWSVGSAEKVTYSFVYDDEGVDKQVVLKENYEANTLDINGDASSEISNLINKEGSAKVLDFTLFTEGGNSYLNSVKKVFMLKTLPNLSEISIDNNGRLVLAKENSVYLVDGSLQSDKYLIGINGKFDINGKDEVANLWVYLPNTFTNFLEVDTFENSKLTATGSPNTYTYGGAESGNVKIMVKPGETYVISLRYVGCEGELQNEISNVSTNMITRSAVKVLSSMIAPTIVGLDELGQKLSLNQSSSYIKIELVEGVDKYWLNVNNENNVEITLTGEGNNATVESFNLQATSGYTLNNESSKVIDGYLYADISKIVEHFRVKEQNFDLSVKAIGKDSLGLTCNKFSEVCQVIIPNTPTNLNYNTDIGEISWNSASKTKFKIEIIYGVKNDSTDFVSEVHYNNITRTNVTVENPTSNCVYYKDEIKISEEWANFEELVSGEISVKYYLCYMCDEIRSIRVAGVSKDEIITSSFAEVSLLAGAKNESFAGGDGSLESPFKISSGSEFARIENHKDKNFVLINNISVSGIYISEFDGTIDGKNKTLTIIDYRRVEILVGGQTKKYATSLIGKNNGELKNINVNIDIASGVNINGSDNSIDRIAVFVLENEGSISNINITGNALTINDSRTNSALEIGIVAYVNRGSINNVVNNLTVNAYGENSRLYVGGIVYQNSGLISQSGNNSQLAGYGIGGVAYTMDKGTISESYNKGKLVANSVGKLQEQTRRIGGLVAWLKANDNVEITYSYVDLKVDRAGSGMVDKLGAFIAEVPSIANYSIKINHCYVNVENLTTDVLNGNLYLFVSSDDTLTISMLGYYNYNSNLNFEDDLSEQSRPEAVSSWAERAEIKSKFMKNSQGKIVLQWENIV